jgi:hypothetical protein
MWSNFRSIFSLQKLTGARNLAAEGWPLVPLEGKRPLIKAWADLADRAPDPEEVEKWPWDRATGVGLVLGQVLAEKVGVWLWALDIENEYRLAAERWLDGAAPGWRSGPVVETGASGLHIYLKTNGTVRTRAVPWGEVRGERGLVVVPPSRHPETGRPYRWISTGEPVELDPEVVPGHGGGTGRDGHKPLDVEEALKGAPLGRRNETLFRLTCKLRGAGVPEEWARELVTRAAERCDPPWGSAPDEEPPEKLVARVYDRYPAGGPHPAPRAGVDGHTAEVNTPPRPALAVAVPPFPVDVLPGQFRKFVMEVADGLGCPPDFVAVPLLPVAAAAVGNRLSIRLNSLWRERPILWTAVVGDPGSGKSPALEQILLPLGRLQTEDYQQWTARLAAWEEERIRAEKEKRKPPPRPRLRHWFTTDVTLEAIAQMLRPPRSEEAEDEETPGLVILMDELTAWVNSFDAYHKRGERERWLQLWAGVAVKVDRAAKDPILISEPAVSVAGGIVPDRLPALEAEARIADGFIERILYTFPDAGVLERFPDPPPLSADLAPLLRRLRLARRGEVNLSPEAEARFRAWFVANARHQGAEKFRPLVRYRAKLPRQVARLALVLHAMSAAELGAEPAGAPIEAQTLEAAIILGEYFVGHAARVMLEFGEGALARRVLGVLTECGDGLTRRQIYDLLGGHVRATDLDGVRDFLAGLGLLRVELAPPGPEGGRPSEIWRICEQTEQTRLVCSVCSQGSGISSPEAEPAPDEWEETEW